MNHAKLPSTDETNDEDDRPILFVGDVQGCAHELGLLLERAKFKSGQHRLIPVGDLVNRGPDAPGVLDLLKEVRAEPIQGNHERGLLKIMHNEKIHPWAKRPEYAYAQFVAVGRWQEAIREITRWPLYREGPGWVAVHAGLHPTLPVEDTPGDYLTEVRFCDEQGRQPKGVNKRQFDAVEGFRPWFENYRGERTVIFGHWAQMGLIRGSNVWGLDTGCVYGRELTGLWWPENRLIQIPAAQVYYPVREPSEDPRKGK